MATAERTRYVLTLVPTPDCADPIRALRWALKGLLRRHHLRCVDLAAIGAASMKEERKRGNTQRVALKE
jgi:hypothetical protein